jgi:hypothetical protein
MRAPLTLLASTLLLAAAPLSAPRPVAGACSAAAAEPPDTYPEHPLSPYQSLAAFDTVFLGEVAVPARPCSLGWCAGLKVVGAVKGKPGKNALVRVAPPSAGACAPAQFRDKGARWVVFANHGTSRHGQRYLYTGDDGPSFIAAELPDFDRLEGRYQARRAELDRAVEERLGKWR